MKRNYDDNHFGMKYGINDNTFFAISDLIDAAKTCGEISEYGADAQEDDVGMARAAIIHAIASIAIADYVKQCETKDAKKNVTCGSI